MPGRGREQSRFRGSTEGARGRSKGALREHEGASREHGRAEGKQKSTKWVLAREQCGDAVYMKLEDAIYILYALMGNT